MRHNTILIALQLLAESLPVSSSGHLQLLKQLLIKYEKLENSVYLSNAFEECLYVLHIPTLIILTLFFRKTWWPLVRHPFRWRSLIIKLIALTALADCVTVSFFFIFKIVPSLHLSLSLGFFITLCLLFSLKWCDNNRNTTLTMRNSLLLGAVQGVALLPGISRCASTFVAARWLGFAPHRAFRVSWMLQVPLIIAAVAKSIWYFLHNMQDVPAFDVITLLVLILCSVGAYILLVLSYRFAMTKRWWWFGFYMLVPLILSLMF